MNVNSEETMSTQTGAVRSLDFLSLESRNSLVMTGVIRAPYRTNIWTGVSPW